MDFWSRLIRGRARRNSASPENVAHQRFKKFKQVYSLIHEAFQSASLPFTQESATANNVKDWIGLLGSILLSESQSPVPHLCLQYVLNEAIYTPISQLAIRACNEPILFQTIIFFSVLADTDDDLFLADRRFAQAVINCVDATRGIGVSDPTPVGEQSVARIVELLFAVAAKIRLKPDLLAAWFVGRPNGEFNPQSESSAPATESQTVSSFTGQSHQEGFPLCYHLVHHVHHDGPIGDFARTGLLYIFDSASHSNGLESWLVNSDLPTLMATGLGALYSQLSRKLSILHPSTDDLPIVLLLSDYSCKDGDSSDAESCFSPNFRKHLGTFLSYLALWQDVLEHCDSASVRESLIEHFRILFLGQLLYPAMIHSSDIDGGSSVAVLTYLRQILETLTHPELVKLVLVYLLAIKSPSPFLSGEPDRMTIKRSGQSQLRLQVLEDVDLTDGPSLFSLSDLVVHNISSSNPQTVTSALRLSATLLQSHHEYTPGTLYRCQLSQPNKFQRTHGGLNAELQEYLSLAAAFGSEEGWDQNYDDYLEDAYKSLESHSCFSYNKVNISGDLEPSRVLSHTLDLNGTLLRSLFDLFDNFLINDVEVNLALTQVFLKLAACQALQLDGWLVVAPQHYILEAEENKPTNPSQILSRIKAARRVPIWDPSNSPLMMQSLERIARQLLVIQSTTPSFHKLVGYWRKAFQLHDQIQGSVPVAEFKSPLKPSLTQLSRTPEDSFSHVLQGCNAPGVPPNNFVSSQNASNYSLSNDAPPTSPVNWLSQRFREALEPISSRSSTRPSSVSPTPIRQAPSQTLPPPAPGPSSSLFEANSSIPVGLATATQAQIQTFRIACQNLADSMASLRTGLSTSDTGIDAFTSHSPSSSNTLSVLDAMMLSKTQYPRLAEANAAVGVSPAVATPASAATSYSYVPSLESPVKNRELGPQLDGRSSVAHVRQTLISGLVEMANRHIGTKSVVIPFEGVTHSRPYGLDPSLPMPTDLLDTVDLNHSGSHPRQDCDDASVVSGKSTGQATAGSALPSFDVLNSTDDLTSRSTLPLNPRTEPPHHHGVSERGRGQFGAQDEATMSTGPEPISLSTGKNVNINSEQTIGSSCDTDWASLKNTHTDSLSNDGAKSTAQGGSENNSFVSSTAAPDHERDSLADGERSRASVQGQKVSLKRVITNVVILQEFVLELVALLQARASLFGEVMLIGSEGEKKK